METVKLNKPKKWTQFVAAFAATLGSFGCGTALAWTAPALPFIDDSQCDGSCDIPNVDAEAASWIGALMPLGAVLAGPVTGVLLRTIGRRATMMSYSVPFAIGCGLYILADEIENAIPIYFGRLLTGFAGGAYALAAPLYIVEMADPKMRGALASLMQLMSCLGVAFVDILSIEDFAHWQIISGVCLIIPVAMMVSLFFMPESPTFLMLRGKEEEAKNALQWFRGKNYNCDEEIEKLKATCETEKNVGSVSLKTLLTERTYYYPFMVAMSLMFMQQFSGVNVVIFYAQAIFRDAGSCMDPGLASFLVAAAQVFGVVIAIMVVDKYGRRILLIISDLFMCLSILVLGVFFYLKENSTISCSEEFACPGVDLDAECTPQDGKYEEEFIKSIGWVPLVSLIVYIIVFSIGFGPLPWTVNAEIFPREAKALGCSIAFCFNWFCAFLVTKFEPKLEEYINASGSYFLFSIICGLGTVFIIFFVPETKGKSPEELKEMFGRKKSIESN